MQQSHYLELYDKTVKKDFNAASPKFTALLNLFERTVKNANSLKLDNKTCLNLLMLYKRPPNSIEKKFHICLCYTATI